MDTLSKSMLTSTNSSPAIAPAHPTLGVKQIDKDVNNFGEAKRIPSLGLVTRKEWVIPPRPKPGRKPATDTPPTKRKAQNRAAQRAFRERRAAIVGELEKKLGEVKEEQQKREINLRARVKQLEAEVESLKAERDSWKIRFNNLNVIFENEKRVKEATLTELTYLRKRSEMTGTEAIPSRHLRKSKSEKQHPHSDLVTDFVSNTVNTATCSTKSKYVSMEETFANTDLGCGNCTLSSSCACMEETLESLKNNPILECKRSLSPLTGTFHEKQSSQSNPCTPLETDFTSQFSIKQTDILPDSIEQIVPTESCGFCEEGTYCLCAEAIAASIPSKEQSTNFSIPLSSKVASPNLKLESSSYKEFSHQIIPPQQNIAYKNGPGTCQQCQIDPRSGAFCRSLSALRGLGNKLPEDFCAKDNGDCCESRSSECTRSLPRLSCADAFKTISSHKNYDQANKELSTWLGHLSATPPSHPGRCPLEVEAASVMQVLRLFDRRFGRD